ncbi:conjugative transfer signal peptidase TraF [Legionella pneumophila]|jgi:conjugative transfer signal peptidase TraF|uniref:conjugative transfer signal peptidase TraF n=1 Tax=Legionella pneumophila TaxID=446 RepID=UPI0002C08840|nr:conjugative transfer signal peptidase TraF [Legionella pneumophila]AGH55369.1 conjugal transfer protein [Legionella pneumophila subsp. pneumophila LPE509]MCW8442379.1 conjugative transfer signal peptidase TraF [Legionella pneumophila]
MKRLAKKVSRILAIASLSFIFLTGLVTISGARLNTSKSIPLGLYWITKHPIQKGAYVLFCPPQKTIFQKALNRGYIHSGFCPGGFGYMMKRVLASHKDVVSINPWGVWVNNRFLEHSVPYPKDEQGRPLPELTLRQVPLKNSELLVMTDQSDLSFDARYFGLIERSQVKAVVKPILTWGSTS